MLKKQYKKRAENINIDNKEILIFVCKCSIIIVKEHD